MATRSAKLLIAGTAGWNIFVNRLLPEPRYVPANLAAATAAVLFSGKSAAELGVARSRMGSGLRWGAAGACLVAAATVAASRSKLTAALFDDERVDPRDVWYQTLLRIPLGTVLLEELLFRALLPSHLEPASVVNARSSALFGLWHVLPTLNTLDLNAIDDTTTRLGAVAAGVAGTAASGIGFSWLRRRSGSLVAPVLVHWAANATAYAVAAGRRR